MPSFVAFIGQLVDENHRRLTQFSYGPRGTLAYSHEMIPFSSFVIHHLHGYSVFGHGQVSIWISGHYGVKFQDCSFNRHRWAYADFNCHHGEAFDFDRVGFFGCNRYGVHVI